MCRGVTVRQRGSSAKWQQHREAAAHNDIGPLSVSILFLPLSPLAEFLLPSGAPMQYLRSSLLCLGGLRSEQPGRIQNKRSCYSWVRVLVQLLPQLSGVGGIDIHAFVTSYSSEGPIRLQPHHDSKLQATSLVSEHSSAFNRMCSVKRSVLPAGM